MPKTIVVPEGTSKPLAPYSPGTFADGILYVSGTLPFDKVIETAGGTMQDVTMNHIFVTDWANYQAVNKVYAEYFPSNEPARYCVQCGLVKPDALVEIATVAHIGKK